VDVIKIGGAANVDVSATCRDVATLALEGRRLVLVHGGSGDTNRLAEELGHPPRFVTSPSGHTSRLTDRRTLEIFIMATAALNRRIVSELQALGVNAVGLSGLDGRLLEAERKAAIRVVENGRVRIVRDDWTGKPNKVNTGLLRMLSEAGYLPVIAPVAISPAGEPLNIDGDRGAALIASELQADTLVLLTGVPGVLRDFPDESTLIPHITVAELPDATAAVEGRMKKKLLGAREALDAGVQRVVIAGSSGDSPVRSALRGGGTVIGAVHETEAAPAPERAP